MKRTSGILGNERGSTIVLVALAMVAMLSAVALAVDIGMLLTARTEAQRAADAAAMAGAGVLILSPGDEDGARAKAIEYGGYNDVLGEPADVWPEDVEVNLVDGIIRVTVHRDASHGNPVPTWFARVFGADLIDVSAVAAATIATGHTAVCLKPWAVMDGFRDNDGDGWWTDGIDQYEPYGFGEEVGSDWRNGLEGTSYDYDVGRELVIKQGDPNEAIQPGWFFPINLPNEDGSPSVGGAEYKDDIVNCNPSPISVDEEYMVETGNMIGPTKQGVNELIDKDPGAYWDEINNEIAGSAYEVSPRLVHIPMFEPTYDVDQGKKPIKFTNIIGMFIEGMDGNSVVGRIMYVSGMADLEGGGSLGPSIKFVQLIE